MMTLNEKELIKVTGGVIEASRPTGFIPPLCQASVGRIKPVGGRPVAAVEAIEVIIVPEA